MLWLFVGPSGVYLLDFFCSGIQFNLLLSPYPCFISLLYLDLPAGKGLTSWLSFVVSSVSLSLSHWYPGSGVVLDCIDS